MSRKTKTKKVAPSPKAKIKKTDKKTVETTISKPQESSKVNTLKSTENAVAKETKHDLIKAVLIVSAIFALEFAIFYATLN